MKKVLNFIKILPVIFNIYLLFIIGSFLFFPYRDDYSYSFFGSSLIISIPLFICSYVPKSKFMIWLLKPIDFLFPKLDLCLWHRLLSLNLSFALILEWIQNKFGLNNFEVYSVYAFFATTIIGLLYALYSMIKYDYTRKKEK